MFGVGQCTGFGVGLQCGPMSVQTLVGQFGVGQCGVHCGVGQCQCCIDGQWNAFTVGQ
jgi:hypothetical protein